MRVVGRVRAGGTQATSRPSRQARQVRKECYIYVIAYWQARGIAAENKPWQLNVSGAENISVLHANYRNLYGEAGGTDAWAVLNVKSTADTITVVSLNQSINQWPMVCVVQ